MPTRNSERTFHAVWDPWSLSPDFLEEETEAGEVGTLCAVLDSRLLMRLSLWQPGTMFATLPSHPVEGLELEGKAL